MIELLHRFGPAATKMWKTDMFEGKTPAILYISSEKIQPPSWAECVLTADDRESDECGLVNGGSIFYPGDSKHPYTIPPHSRWPQVAGESPKPFFENERVAVVMKPEEAPEGKEIYVIPDAVKLLDEPEKLLSFVQRLRNRVGYLPLIYAPGVMLPNRIPFLVYSGIDLMDNSLVYLYGVEGRHLTPDGYMDSNDGRRICGCEYCDAGDIHGHNNHTSKQQLELTVTALKNGTLRELAEIRAATSAELVAGLRVMDRSFGEYQEAGLPVTGKALKAYTTQSLERPDIIRFQKRVSGRYLPPPRKILLLLPCSMRKPYSSSRSHRRFREVIQRSGMELAVHEVIVTSPMGIVPRELETYYPAAHYDIPVTGEWSDAEKRTSLKLLRNLMERNGYESVLIHLPYDFVMENIDGVHTVVDGRPTSSESLEKLAKSLKELSDRFGPKSRKEYAMENMIGRATFQFGEEAGRKLTEGATLRGRYPFIRIMDNAGKQRGMLTDRGNISLTMEGGRILLESWAYTVEIEDFPMKGNVFAVGVNNATGDIRIGDEVAVAHKGELRAVGTAMMTPKDMAEGERGLAVRVRHHIKA